MQLFTKASLKNQILLSIALLVTLVFLLVIGFTSYNANKKLEESIYHDIATKNQGYVYTILSTFEAKAEKVLALRDDLELYDTLGQMWVHIAAHAGVKVFDDPVFREEHVAAFRKKLSYYQKTDQLSADKMTPQLQKMLDNITTNKNAFGDGMKFFYIGVSAPNKNKTIQGYDQYQDSSLWVPDPTIEEEYNPLVRPWYLAGQEAGRGKVIFTEPYAERRTGEALASASTSININGVTGTLAGAISIKPIMDDILARFQENAQITIFSKGVEKATAFVATPPKYIYSSRDDSLGDNFKAYNEQTIIQDVSNNDIMKLYDFTKQNDSGVVEWVINGEERLVAFNTVPDVGWKLFMSVSKEQMMSEATRVKYQTIIIAVVSLLLLLLIISLIVNRTLLPIGIIGEQLDELAETGDLSRRITVEGSREVRQMSNAINEMLDNTALPVKKLAERANRIAKGNLTTDINISSKGDIADLVESFKKMTDRLIEFDATSRDASPLTGLPGGVSIEKMVQKRIEEKVPFAFCIFDLDSFKPFNDKYGYSRGNSVIRNTADIILNALKAHGGVLDFVGHIGGDDFIVIASPKRYRDICEAVKKDFDSSISGFYDESEREAGFITSKNRQGGIQKFPIMTISIGAVDSQKTELHDYIQVSEIAAELKSYVKSLKGSNFVTHRRAV